MTVSEVEIASAVATFCDRHKKVVEGAAGVALAAFLKDEHRDQSAPAVVIACGANIGVESLLSVLRSGRGGRPVPGATGI